MYLIVWQMKKQKQNKTHHLNKEGKIGAVPFFNFARYLNKLVLGNLRLRKKDCIEHIICIKREE